MKIFPLPNGVTSTPFLCSLIFHSCLVRVFIAYALNCDIKILVVLFVQIPPLGYFPPLNLPPSEQPYDNPDPPNNDYDPYNDPYYYDPYGYDPYEVSCEREYAV